MDKNKEDQIFSDNGRLGYTDKRIDNNISGENLSNKLFVRLSAKGIKFNKVDFKHNIFDDCYLRDCVFESCDFTGCKFKDSNLYGSKFDGCKFDYSTFERTIVNDEILRVGCPGWENIRLKFARSLRVNFQQIGNTDAVNKAIEVELAATGEHLLKAWKSNESYYRKKFKGFKRAEQFIKWLNFRVLNFIWGNGESALKLARSMGIIFLLIALYHVLRFQDPIDIKSYIDSFLQAPQIFFGGVTPVEYHKEFVSLIIFLRLLMMGFFLSIIIKRFNKR